MFSKIQICRALHTALTKYARRQHRSKYLIKEMQNIKGEEQDIADIESDFMNVHKTHSEYENEQDEQRMHTRRHIIKKKYFRDAHLPNMLSYAEKEQIRLLHARSSGEWSVEKLAEAFPANLETIAKVLRAKWRPQNAKRLKTHDEAVLLNWQKLLKNDDKFTEQFPNELREHLKKFSKRQMTSYELSNRMQLSETQSKEFSSIISTCKKYKNLQIDATTDVARNPFTASLKTVPATVDRLEDETFLMDSIVDKRQLRLQELKELKLQMKTTDESLIKNTNVTRNLNSFDDIIVKKFEENEIEISQEDAVRYDITPFKTHIHIPRKLWQKGFTYRVHDTYYDDDGEFLYKVPGMTGNK